MKTLNDFCKATIKTIKRDIKDLENEERKPFIPKELQQKRIQSKISFLQLLEDSIIEDDTY